MPYDGDPGGSIEDEVRFLIGDTDTTDELFSDDEIDYLVAEHETAIRAAYHGSLALAAKYAGMQDIAVGSAREEYGSMAQRFTDLSKSLAARGGDAGINTSKVGPPYATGLTDDDNPLQSTKVDWYPKAFG